MSPPLGRRRFLGSSLLGLVSAGLPASLLGAESGPSARGFSQDAQKVRLRAPGVAAPLALTVVADTHLFRDDARGQPYASHSARMAKAYNRTRHHLTGEPTGPEEGFRAALAAAAAARSSHVVLAGDLLSFPSEAGVEWALEELRSCGLPWLYTAGNHDWHYEGMEGSLDALRETWIARRLSPLYRGHDPMMTAQEVGGVRLLLIDNSTYEVSAAQLAFFRRQVASGRPLILFLHIPLHVPGRPVAFGCGHPEWGAASDRGYALERRPRWREGGHTAVTLDFRREVFAAPNLLGVFAGHTHRASLDIVAGVPQCVVPPNANGGFLHIEVVPA